MLYLKGGRVAGFIEPILFSVEWWKVANDLFPNMEYLEYKGVFCETLLCAILSTPIEITSDVDIDSIIGLNVKREPVL
jgi:hypothetical protein